MVKAVVGQTRGGTRFSPKAGLTRGGAERRICLGTARTRQSSGASPSAAWGHGARIAEHRRVAAPQRSEHHRPDPPTWPVLSGCGGGRAWSAAAEIDRPGEPAQLRLALALCDALLRLVIQARRLCGRHAALHRAAHDHSPPDGTESQLEFVTGPDLTARLDRHPVDVHAPALDGLRRQRARL